MRNTISNKKLQPKNAKTLNKYINKEFFLIEKKIKGKENKVPPMGLYLNNRK